MSSHPNHISKTPRISDDDLDTISVILDGKRIRGWIYANETERRAKMLAAREFAEGWCAAIARATEGV